MSVTASASCLTAVCILLIGAHQVCAGGWDLKGDSWAPVQKGSNVSEGTTQKTTPTSNTEVLTKPEDSGRDQSSSLTAEYEQKPLPVQGGSAAPDKRSSAALVEKSADYCRKLWSDMAKLLQSDSGDPTPESGSANEARDAVGRAWDGCRNRITVILGLVEEKRGLPEKALFGRDQGDVDERIEQILEDVVLALEISGLSDCRAKYMALGDQIRQAQQQTVVYEERKISAPSQTSGLNPFSMSQSECEEKINVLRRQIAGYRKQQDELVTIMHQEYRRIGVDISREQARFYLESVSGDDIVSLSAVFNNVKELSGKLEELMRKSDANADAQRRYYGVHVVLVQALLHAHDMMIERIDNRYLPRLKKITDQNREVGERTRVLIQQEGAAHAVALEANLRAQEHTAKAVALYEQHLVDLRKRTDVSREGARKRYLVAKNTYDTIVIASALLDEMEACVRDLMVLKDMHLPDMVPLDDQAVQEKFFEISVLLADK